MGANAGPDIVSDGLVLALDAADNNSFRGEPTENLFPNPQFLNHTNNSAGAASITKKTFDNGRIGIEMIQGSTSDIVSFGMGNLGSTGVSGGTYTWSSYINCTSTGNKVKAQVSVYVDGTRHWLTNSNTWTTSVVECSHLFSPTVANSWHRIENTFTLPTGTLTNFSLGGFYRNTSNFTLKIADAHLELNPAATRFTTGTRGTTVAAGGGWADISGNDNHGEILNGTTTSNDGSVLGALDFDGTDDYIDLPILDNSNGEVTVEVVFKLDTLTGDDRILMNSNWWGPYSLWIRQSNQRLYWITGTSSSSYTVTSATGYTPGNWYHAVGVRKSGFQGLYVNGTLVASNTSPVTMGSTVSTTPTVASGGTFDGVIPIVKAYNRALTASEVLQNYNTTKTRFGL